MDHKLITFLSLLALMILNLNGCDPYEQNDFEERYVVEAYLIAENSLPPVQVSTTLPVDQVYTFENAAVDSAEVTISRIGEDGEIEQQTHYHQPDTGRSGFYYPRETEDQIVEPITEYRLTVQPKNAGDPITARTFVPDTFSVQETVQDSVVYQSQRQLKTVISPVRTPFQNQAHFIFTILAGEPLYSNLTPFYKSQVDDGDDTELSDFVKNNSGILNEGNFDKNPDGSISLNLPWLGFAFYGENATVTSSIDKNIYDYRRSQSVQTGSNTLSPGQIQNVIYHVENGIGVFGSMSSDTISTYLQRPGTAR